MVCEICHYGFGINDNGDHYYLLLIYGDTYQACYNNQYTQHHTNHENAEQDVMICTSCYTMYMRGIAQSDSKYKLPGSISKVQGKRFILEIFRRHDAENRIKG